MERFIPLQELVPVEHDPFVGPAIARSFPTTEPQREVWLSSLMGAEASCAYNESVSLRLTGRLDPTHMSAAVEAIVRRHGSLRSVFSASGIQMIELAEVPSDLERIDLSALEQNERRERLEALDAEWMSTPFDLENGPLFRPLLVTLAPEEHILRFIAHHSICDGWSLGILMGDVSVIYSALVRGASPALPDAVDFSHYAEAVDEFRSSEEHRRVKQYWLDLYADGVPRTDLPVDAPRPLEKTYNATRIDVPLAPELVTGLKRVGSRYGSTLVATMLSAFEVLLARKTGQLDLVVGLPAAGQSDMDLKNLVGHCVSLLPLRTRLELSDRFCDHLGKRRSAVLDAYDNQRFTLGSLLQDLDIPREPGRVPLAPVVFNFDMNMDDGVAFEGLGHVYSSDPRSYEHFELALNCAGKGEHLVLEWGFNTDLFEAATIRGWNEELTAIIQAVCNDPEVPLDRLVGPTANGRATAMPPVEWQGKRVPLAKGRTACSMFEEQAATHGGKPAVLQGDRAMTYDELDAASMRFAIQLQRSGIRRGDLVGILSTPSPEMVAAMLGVLRAGAAFVPLDINLPEERINGIMEDAQVKRVLVQDGAMVPIARPSTSFSEAGKAIDGGVFAPVHLTGEDAAYVIYTSGSTGKPKGVVVPHRGLVRLFGPNSFLRFSADLVWMHHLSISFDASIVGIWGSVLMGGTVVMAREAKPSLNDLADAMIQHRVNAIATSSGLFELMVDERMDALQGLRYLATGGDIISIRHARMVLEQLGPGVLVNAYGPTENAVASTSFILEHASELERPLPIGKPFENALVYVLNEQLRPVAIGERGELYTAGPGTALGYLGRPDLTAERFIKDPFDPEGGLMYKTGDMVRWLPDGNLEFLGRADDQVKVRGFRIELGEIDTALNGLALIGQKAVVVHAASPTEKEIVAYVTPAGKEPITEALCERIEQAVIDHLSPKLPEYMVPAAVVVLERMPLNNSGKVDKARLPRPQRIRTRERAVHTPPGTATEKALAAIWEKLLGVSNVGVNDNFFELGGHSLLGLQMFAQAEKQLGPRLQLKTLFQAPTIAQLARLITEDAPGTGLKNLIAVQPKGRRTPFFCVHGDEANLSLPRHLGDDQPFYGFAHQGEDGSAIRYTSVETLAAHLISEMRTVRPHGPYFLGGYSFGGMVAYEMAQQLRASGEEVPMLVLFDTYAPSLHEAASEQEEKVYTPIKRVAFRWMIERVLEQGKLVPPRLRNFHIIDTYDQAALAYKPKPYAGRLTMFKSTDSWGPDEMGWTDLAVGGLEIQRIPGDHYSMIKEPNVGRIADELSRRMTELQGKRTRDGGGKPGAGGGPAATRGGSNGKGNSFVDRSGPRMSAPVVSPQLAAPSPVQAWSNLDLLQREGDGHPVFGVHCDEANQAFPLHWGPTRPYYAFRHQGAGGTRVTRDRVEDIAAHFIDELKQAKPVGPYFLCGYSFGGLVAYEMAQQLMARGDEVPFLALIETFAPTLHEQSVRADTPFHFRMRLAAVRTLAKPYFRSERRLPARLHHYHIMETYDRATLAYQPKPFHGPLTVLKAEGAWGPDDMGWHELAKGGLDVEIVPGDHHSMLLEPNVAILAARMQDRIARAERRS